MGRLRRGGLSVSTGIVNERVLLDRVLPLRPEAVTSDARTRCARRDVGAHAGRLISRRGARAWP
jgi:hypothetical protein